MEIVNFAPRVNGKVHFINNAVTSSFFLPLHNYYKNLRTIFKYPQNMHTISLQYSTNINNMNENDDMDEEVDEEEEDREDFMVEEEEEDGNENDRSEEKPDDVEDAINLVKNDDDDFYYVEMYRHCNIFQYYKVFFSITALTDLINQKEIIETNGKYTINKFYLVDQKNVEKRKNLMCNLYNNSM